VKSETATGQILADTAPGQILAAPAPIAFAPVAARRISGRTLFNTLSGGAMQDACTASAPALKDPRITEAPGSGYSGKSL